MPTQAALVQTALGLAELAQTEVQALELAEVLVVPIQVGALVAPVQVEVLVLVVGARADLAAVLPAGLVAEVQVLAAGASVAGASADQLAAALAVVVKEACLVGHRELGHSHHSVAFHLDTFRPDTFHLVRNILPEQR